MTAAGTHKLQQAREAMSDASASDSERRAGPLRPTVYCPPDDVDRCVGELRPWSGE